VIVDMFAGPGGVDCGARLLGLDDPIGFEWDADACATRAAAGMPTIRCDVTKYRPPENSDEMYERSVDDPAPTLTSRGDMWQLRPGKQPNATVRTADEPAPTVAFGRDASQWMWERPATVILGDPRVSPPNRSGGAPQGASPVTTDGVLNGEYVDPLASVRLTVEEAAALQSFPPDWPFSGSKSARFLQVGNSCPPVMMAHVLAAATGTPIPDVWCDPLVRVDGTDVTEGDDDG
jgi:site-specific DNA-cytosine methylase